MFEPLRKERTFEVIVKQLRESIYSGRFKPGDKLPTEREFAEVFNVSRAAVRSAVLNLEQSGLLEIRKGSGGGFFVRELDFKPALDYLNDLLKLGKTSISDLTEIRGILEPEATRMAAERAEKEDIEKMEQSILTLQKRMSQGLTRRSDDFNFHVCVAEGTKNPSIIFFMRALTEIIFQTIGSYVITPQNNERIISQHKQILDAIKLKDPEKARAVAIMHVKAMKELFKKYEGANHT